MPQCAWPAARGTNSSRAPSPPQLSAKVVVLDAGGRAYTTVNKRVMLRVQEKPHRNWRCEVCLLADSDAVALYGVGVDPGFRPLQLY